MSYNVVGHPVTRVDAWDKVTGYTIYPGDRDLEDQLWLKVLFARRPHARVIAIDTTEAEQLPGVVTILTAKDVPVNEYGLQKSDQPVLCGPGSDKEGTDIVRFVGDQVAVVVAESEKIAAQARDLIKVTYQELPVITNPTQAMQPGSYQLHPDSPDNIVQHHQIHYGDVEASWASCDVIIEETYHTPPQEHAYLQPEAATAYLDKQGRITVYTAGQWTWEDQQQIAHALNLPPEKIRVIYDAIGGAFGGREDMSVQIICALAVYKLAKMDIKRPVKIIWSREESIIGHCKRHPMTIWTKWGAKQDGTLVAAEAKIISDAGAYIYTSNKVLANTTISVTGPYFWPNAKVNAYAIYTNNVPSGAFRGFGTPQALFVAENQMNKLAVALSMDPVVLRLKNILDDEKPLTVGTAIPGIVNLKEVLEKTALAAGWIKEEDYWLFPQSDMMSDATTTIGATGIGIALALKNIGFSLGYPENSWAHVKLEGEKEIEKAIVSIAGAEVGQGHHTAMAQIAAEALKLPVEKIKLNVSDTKFTKSSGSASASRLTMIAGNAVKGAALGALARWNHEERPAEAEYTWKAPPTTPFDEKTGRCMPNFAYGYVAQAAEVSVDTETGFITVNRIICADDVGQAVNPQQVTGQIEGAIVQAHGYTLLEDFRTENGQVLTPNLSTYLIPGVYDIPDRVESILVETPHPEGPYGARGVGEMPYICYAPAITAAVHNAVGVWINKLPLTPERVLRSLGKIN